MAVPRAGAARTSWLLAVAVLWILGAGFVAAGAFADWRGRASSPEAPLRTYLAAVTNEDLEAALDEIRLSTRAEAAPFVAEQLGNEYRVLGLGVRQPSLPGPMPTIASRPRGRPIRAASSGAGARATAQVARADLRFGTTSAPVAPTAASAAPSATP